MHITPEEYQRLITIASRITKGSTVEPLDLVHDAILQHDKVTAEVLFILHRDQLRAANKITLMDIGRDPLPGTRRGETYCARCKQPFTKTKIDEIGWHCPECKLLYNRERYQRNRVEILKQQKKYAQSKRGKKLKSKAKKRYYQRNKESIKAKAKKNYEFNKWLASL